MNKLKVFLVFILIVFMGLLLSCGGGASSKNVREKKLASWRIDTWMNPAPDSTTLLVLRGDESSPVLYLRYQGRDERIGAMTRSLGDAPVLAQFVDVDGNRFIVMLVDKSVRPRTNGVLIYRPDPDFPGHPEKSRKLKSVIMDKHGMIVVPLGPNHASEWTHLAGLILTARKATEENPYEKFYSSPFSISHLFQILLLH